MAGTIQFTLHGEAQHYAGRISGRGSLRLSADASTLSFALDYRSSDCIVLSLSGEQGIRLSASDRLLFSGSVSADVVNRSWSGQYQVRLEISRQAAARLSQEFTRQGTRTSAEFTIRF